jgi:hypothetical protein
VAGAVLSKERRQSGRNNSERKKTAGARRASTAFWKRTPLFIFEFKTHTAQQSNSNAKHNNTNRTTRTTTTTENSVKGESSSLPLLQQPQLLLHLVLVA